MISTARLGSLRNQTAAEKIHTRFALVVSFMTFDVRLHSLRCEAPNGKCASNRRRGNFPRDLLERIQPTLNHVRTNKRWSFINRVARHSAKRIPAIPELDNSETLFILNAKNVARERMTKPTPQNHDLMDGPYSSELHGTTEKHQSRWTPTSYMLH